jgi:hypothetical protein
MRNNTLGEERSTYIQVANDHLMAIMGSEGKFHTLVSPYLKMDQKRVRTPIEWFHDANAKRLSYSDKN